MPDVGNDLFEAQIVLAPQGTSGRMPMTRQWSLSRMGKKGGSLPSPDRR